MIDEHHYIPILKGRAAEYDALSELDDAVRDGLTPLIEIMAVPWNHVEARESVDLSTHVQSCATKMSATWGQRSFFVDFALLRTSQELESGKHPFELFFDLSRELGSSPVPVVSPRSDGAYRSVVRDANASDSRGLCLRVTSADLANPGVEDELNTLVAEIGADLESCDLLVDLHELNEESFDFNLVAAWGLVNAVPAVDRWRSLILAGSSFPEDLRVMKPSSEKRVKRGEWAVWTSLRERRLNRNPAFADYAISHPDPPGMIDPRLLRISAQLRYTCADEWLVFKERNIRDYGNEQFIDICERLVRMDEFAGKDFSWGDDYIATRAAGQDRRPGNPRMWRKVGTNHHLELVLSQLANLDT